MTGWDAVRAELARVLTELTEGEFLVVGEPEAEPGPPRGLLRRRAAPAPQRYVQFRDDGDHLYAECVGTTPMGGDWPADPATADRVRALGWLLPDEDDGSGAAPAYPNYWRVAERARAAELADLGTRSLEVLGADPSTLVWRRDRV